jgi:hypothetical protein
MVNQHTSPPSPRPRPRVPKPRKEESTVFSLGIRFRRGKQTDDEMHLGYIEYFISGVRVGELVPGFNGIP